MYRFCLRMTQLTPHRKAIQYDTQKHIRWPGRMIEQSYRDRVAYALDQSNSESAVHYLAIAMKAEGMTQPDMHELFVEFLGKHIDDVDETKYNAVYELLTAIEGDCAAHSRIYPKL